MQNTSTRHLTHIAILAGMLLLAAWPAHVSLAQTASNAQLAALALSSGDVPGFHLVSEQDVPVQASDPIASAWQRVLAADDVAGTSGAAISVLLMVPKTSVSTSSLADTVNGGSVFANLSGVTNVQLTGPIGIGDVDQSATWLQWDPDAATWGTFHADNFLQGRLLVGVIFGSDNDTVGEDQLMHYAQLQQSKLLAAGPLPASLLAVPQAPLSPAPALPGTASAFLPAVPAAILVPTIIADPSVTAGALTFLPIDAPDTTSAPAAAPAPTTTPTAGAVLTRCKDGSVSRSTGPGTCSSHGGEAR
jgi:hypothetical protein